PSRQTCSHMDRPTATSGVGSMSHAAARTLAGRFLHPSVLALACWACSAGDKPMDVSAGFTQGVRVVPIGTSHQGSQLVVGSPPSLLKGLERAQTGIGSPFVFATTAGESIGVEIEDFYLANGQLSMTGR